MINHSHASLRELANHFVAGKLIRRDRGQDGFLGGFDGAVVDVNGQFRFGGSTPEAHLKLRASAAHRVAAIEFHFTAHAHAIHPHAVRTGQIAHAAMVVVGFEQRVKATDRVVVAEAQMVRGVFADQNGAVHG